MQDMNVPEGAHTHTHTKEENKEYVTDLYIDRKLKTRCWLWPLPLLRKPGRLTRRGGRGRGSSRKQRHQ